MATIRQRRAGTNPPAEAPDTQEDRVYTEEDYALPAQEDTLPDEWATGQGAYAAASWTGETLMPDDAFEPDEEEYPADGVWEEDAFSAGFEPPYDPLFEESFDMTGDLAPLAEDLLTEEEQAELRRSHWQLLAGLADFAGVILGTAAILVLVTLLVNLVNWLVNDMSQSFILLQKHL